MNTQNTQVEDIRKATEDIMKERISQTAKREKLLRIGLTNSDIHSLFFAERLAKKMAKKERDAARQIVADTLEQIFARYTFGVEIECYNARPAQLVTTATAHGLNMQHESYNHNDNDRYYKLVSDGSIRGVNPIECVSPILNGNNGGFDSLKACCDSLNEIGAKVNRSTGLHVHVGGSINESQYCNVFVNYYYLETIIDTFMSESRRQGNCFCKPLSGINEASLNSASSARQIESVFNCDRYFKVNATAWCRHHTIEFRQHQGTTDYEKISNWARFCIKLVHWSDTHRLTARVNSIDEIEFLTDAEKTYFKNRQNALRH